MAIKCLVVVESPTKINALKKYLGDDFEVLASKGHVKDLPDRSLGVDVDNEFTPQYVVIPGKEKTLREIKSAADKASVVYLAPDPDREGEAIAWHIASEINKKPEQMRRILIQEITKKGITDAIAHPTKLDVNRFESQQARRILDRLVGYQISPLLWRKVKKGLSAGRVQSVAVRMICERESEIKSFKPEEYWTIDIHLQASEPPAFQARFVGADGKKLGKELVLNNADATQEIADRISKKPIVVAKVQKKERKRNPVAPFTTSKLQQEAFRKLGFNVKRTMSVAQSLYEGVELGGEGPVGLITYMRTDSTRIADDAVKDVRAFIESTYGKPYLPDEPIVYKTKKSAQDAHEAVRPTSISFPPDKIEKHLSKEQMQLYKLIWNRFVACQMQPAVFDQIAVDLKGDDGKIELRAGGSRLIFNGFLEVYQEGNDEIQRGAYAEDDENAQESRILPPLQPDQKLKLDKVETHQHFTQPPPRFNESSIVKELDEKGIGRPSTYATILSTITDRGYVKKVENRYEPTMLGEKVNELLVQSFPEIVNDAFTAEMEENLDKVEEGTVEWRKLLRDFYKPFAANVRTAETEMKNVKSSSEPTDITCDKCNEGKFVIKWSARGEFLGCGNYPKCRNTREFDRDENGAIVVRYPKLSGDKCAKCGKDMVFREGRFGQYIACINYPTCPTIKNPKSDIKCPEEGCSGYLVPRRSKVGKNFWACTNYPGCQYAVWNKPITEKCPSCSFPLMTEKFTKRDGASKVCPSCKASIKVDAPAGAESAVDDDDRAPDGKPFQ